MAHITDDAKADNIVKELDSIYAEMDRLADKARFLRESLAGLVKAGNKPEFDDIN